MTHKPEMLDQYLDEDGNTVVDLTDRNGVTTTALVAELVLLTHRGPKPSPDAKPWHLNGDKTDNRLYNLAWWPPKSGQPLALLRDPEGHA